MSACIENMKSDIEIFKSGVSICSGVSHYEDGGLIHLDGCYFPFRGQVMQNPLDPANLLLCPPVFVDEPDCDDDSEDDGTAFIEKVLNTLLHVTDIRENGYRISTRYLSGAPRTIIQNGTEKTVILGDYSKENNLLLPLLSTQLADEQYSQERVDAWKIRGFKTAPKYKCFATTYTDNLEGNQCGLMAFVSSGKKEQTYYNIYGGGLKISVVKKHVDVEIEDYEEDDDGDFEGRDYTNWRINSVEKEIRHPVSNKPTYVWQDNGEQND